MEDTSNKLWRFGDSWAQTLDDYEDIESNHSKYISDYFGLEYLDKSIGGIGNLQIFTNILKYSNEYKKGDIILVNFGNIHRVEIFNKGNFECTVQHYDTQYPSDEMQKIVSYDLGYVISDTIFYLMKTYIESLIKKGIRVYNFHGDSSDYQYKVNIKNELIFENNIRDGYIGWCYENDYVDLSLKGNGHYKVGSQKSIANKIIELIEENDN